MHNAACLSSLLHALKGRSSVVFSSPTAAVHSRFIVNALWNGAFPEHAGRSLCSASSPSANASAARGWPRNHDRWSTETLRGASDPRRCLSSAAKSSAATAKSPSRTLRKMTAAQARRVFGTELPSTTANRLLETLQEQRLMGRLDEDVRDLKVNSRAVNRALAWLRANYPLDEDAALRHRVATEEDRFDARLSEEAENIRSWTPGQRTEGLLHSERSVLDQVQEQRKIEARRAERAARRAAKSPPANVRTGLPAVQDSRAQSLSEARANSRAWVQKYKDRAAIIKNLESDKAMLKWRLIPCVVFAITFIAACAQLSLNYRQPRPEARLWTSVSPATATIGTIVGLNCLGFLAWKIPPLWAIMNKYFLVIAVKPQPFSLLGSVFSHQQLGHLTMNMCVLWLTAPRLHEELGRGNFLALYLGSGVAASTCSLARLTLMKMHLETTLGASGAILSTISASLWLKRDKPVTLPFLPNEWSISPNTLLVILCAMDIVGILGGQGGIDFVAHFSGTLSGIAWAEWFHRRAQRASSLDEEEL